MPGEAVSDMGEISPRHGLFAVLGNKATMSSLSLQGRQEGMQFVDVITEGGEKVHLSIPEGEDRVKFIKRVLELMQQGETRGAIIVEGDM
jgi:hypothetical protein